MTTYSDPDPEVLALLADAMRRWHPQLHDAGVRVGVLMAANEDGPAVKHAGYPALATIKVVSLKDRLKKQYDAELLLDQSEWNDMRREHREALVDHELSHIVLAKYGYKAGREEDDPDERGEIWCARDDLGRPKLKIRLADWNAGDGFADVIRRHGMYAAELENLRRCQARADAANAEHLGELAQEIGRASRNEAAQGRTRLFEEPVDVA